jgi:DnaJ-domain-containing protein 1
VGSSFLMEIMELRERIDELTTEADLQALQSQNQRQMEHLGEELTSAFDKNDLDEALRFTAMLQYHHRVDETVREKME